MRNAGVEETQAGIKIAGRNINNLSSSYLSRNHMEEILPSAEFLRGSNDLRKCVQSI